MSFDLDAFEQADLRARTARVPVPALAQWFGEGEAAEFVVRGVTGAELAAAREAKERNRNVASLAAALASGGAAQAEALKSALGVGDEVPDDLAYRLALVVSGCVAPALTQPQAVRLAQHFPVEFFAASNRILELSGEGSRVGEPDGCTQTTASA
mgnify:FL=1